MYAMYVYWTERQEQIFPKDISHSALNDFVSFLMTHSIIHVETGYLSVVARLPKSRKDEVSFVKLGQRRRVFQTRT